MIFIKIKFLTKENFLKNQFIFNYQKSFDLKPIILTNNSKNKNDFTMMNIVNSKKITVEK